MEGWLALSRNIGETVMIGDDTEVKVVEVAPGKVRLAFRAPPDVRILRREIYDTIKQQGGNRNE